MRYAFSGSWLAAGVIVFTGFSAGFVGTARADEAKVETATAEIKDATGKKLGDALLEQTPHGVLITADLSGLPPGPHAFHIHETGVCTAPDFKSAKGHFNPTAKKHGIKAEGGMHCGDLPNVEAGADGKAKFQFLDEEVTLKAGEKNTLLDADGAALVLHKIADDHKSDPAGAAGDRIACGVVTAKK